MNVVILAAGVGARMKNLTKSSQDSLFNNSIFALLSLFFSKITHCVLFNLCSTKFSVTFFLKFFKIDGDCS